MDLKSKLPRVFLFSKSRDIVLIPIDSDLKPLQIAESVPSPGCSLIIAGNPEAEHTFISLNATLKATGPDRLEVVPNTGNLQPGMSGGPVVEKNGKVVGITTYAVKKYDNTDNKYDIERFELDNGIGISRYKTSFQLTIRNFAFRLDNLKQADLQSVTWSDFFKGLRYLVCNGGTLNECIESRLCSFEDHWFSGNCIQTSS